MSGQYQAARIKTVAGTVQFFYTDPARSEFAQKLTYYGQAARDMSTPLNEFLGYQLRSIDRNFGAEGRPERWEPLAHNTIRDRLRRGFGEGPILQRTGKLRRGFRGQAGKRSLRLWNTRFYFPYHQFGVPENHLPARQMIVLLAQDKAAFTRLMRRHLGGNRG